MKQASKKRRLPIAVTTSRSPASSARSRFVCKLHDLEARLFELVPDIVEPIAHVAIVLDEGQHDLLDRADGFMPRQALVVAVEPLGKAFAVGHMGLQHLCDVAQHASTFSSFSSVSRRGLRLDRRSRLGLGGALIVKRPRPTPIQPSSRSCKNGVSPGIRDRNALSARSGTKDANGPAPRRQGRRRRERKPHGLAIGRTAGCSSIGPIVVGESVRGKGGGASRASASSIEDDSAFCVTHSGRPLIDALGRPSWRGAGRASARRRDGEVQFIWTGSVLTLPGYCSVSGVKLCRVKLRSDRTAACFSIRLIRAP